jgi:PAS domain S-box-containing protein
MKAYRAHFLAMLVVALAAATGFSTSLFDFAADWRFRLTSRAPTGDIALIAIDPHSIETMGSWPWSRSIHADLIRKLNAVGVSDIVFDVDFSSPSTQSADADLAEAIKGSTSSIVLPAFQQSKKNGSPSVHDNLPIPLFSAYAWVASASVKLEKDGRARKYDYSDRIGTNLVPSVAAAMSGNGSITKPPFYIDHGIRFRNIPIVSYSDVLDDNSPSRLSLRGKKVLIGGTAIELGDRFSVPNASVLPGPLLQILAAESIAQGRALSATSSLVSLMGVTLSIIAMICAWSRLSAKRRLLLIAFASIALEASALCIQNLFPVIVDTSLLQITLAAYLLVLALQELDILGLMTRVAERRFRNVAMSMGDALICMDANLCITFWNPAAGAIFGYQPPEMIGNSFTALIANSTDSSATAAVTADLIASQNGRLVEFRGVRKDGQTFEAEACISSWDDTDGISYGVNLRDVSIRKREAEKIRYLAEFDSFTGLPNRYTIERELAALLASSDREHCLFIVRVNRVSDASVIFGRSFSGELVKAVGSILERHFRVDHYHLARIGDETFAILAYDCTVDAASKVAATLKALFDEPICVGERLHHAQVRIGAARLPEHGTTTEYAFGNAYIALDKGKADGAANFYEVRDRALIEKRLATEAELIRALENDEFELFYQPQVCLKSKRVIGAEALIRWRHPTRGLVPPIEFIPIANATTVSVGMSRWVVETAWRQASRWAAAGHEIRVGINLSPCQFADDSLVAQVQTLLRDAPIRPALIELEVTEDILLDDEAQAKRAIESLKQSGVRLVFDDFGTGFGSLSYLKSFPLHGLKIDRSFVKDALLCESDRTIVRSVIGLAEGLNLSVIAEGIEDEATADLLSAMGCREGQGYYFGRPCPADEFERQFFSIAGHIAA